MTTSYREGELKEVAILPGGGNPVIHDIFSGHICWNMIVKRMNMNC